MSENPYEVLGVGKGATDAEINAAFKKAAKRTHPDLGGDANEFGRVRTAAVILLNPEKRKKFDNTGAVDDDPDNMRAKVMESIASFFINSIEALDKFGAPALSQTNLVEAATIHFKNQIHMAKTHIQDMRATVSKFDKALKRLKTKTADDPITSMLRHHRNQMQNNIDKTKGHITQFELAISILQNYEFEVDATANSQYHGATFQGFFRT